MKTPADFEPFVIAYAPFVPSEYVQHYIRETVIEFMRESKVAKAFLEFDTQEKVPDYMLEMPDCRRIVKVLNVHRTPITASGKDNWVKLRTGDYPEYEVQLRQGEHPMLVLTDVPKKPERVRVEYNWTLARDNCDIPDFIYEDYMGAIVAGTLIKIAMLPDQRELKVMINTFQQSYFTHLQNAKIERTGGKAKRIVSSSFLPSKRRGSIWR